MPFRYGVGRQPGGYRIELIEARLERRLERG